MVILNKLVAVLPFPSSERYISNYVLDSRKTLYFLISAVYCHPFARKAYVIFSPGSIKQTNYVTDKRRERCKHS